MELTWFVVVVDVDVDVDKGKVEDDDGDWELLFTSGKLFVPGRLRGALSANTDCFQM